MVSCIKLYDVYGFLKIGLSHDCSTEGRRLYLQCLLVVYVNALNRIAQKLKH